MAESFAALLATVRSNLVLPDVDEQRRILASGSLTQRDVARAVGCSRYAVGKWLAGVNSPRGDVRRRYHELLIAVERQVAEIESSYENDVEEALST